ncbi:MAG: hypothetical protein J6S18_00430, partial [Oscillospiraceae bacterium]|nr:hypothetical protein [Oscillospiraceae bacterium]
MAGGDMTDDRIFCQVCEKAQGNTLCIAEHFECTWRKIIHPQSLNDSSTAEQKQKNAPYSFPNCKRRTKNPRYHSYWLMPTLRRFHAVTLLTGVYPVR